MWVDNKAHGKGVFTYKDTDVYDGNWENNSVFLFFCGILFLKGEWVRNTEGNGSIIQWIF